jgi:hypothetical protein
MSPEFQTLLRDLLGIASEGAKREQILSALSFGDMYGRFEDVEPAHFETFEWIFDEAYDANAGDDVKPVEKVNDGWKSPAIHDDPESEDDNATLNPSDSGEDTEIKEEEKTRFGDLEHDYSVREPFLHWLSAGNGIFHISGKLGSGKSTLMKFLCDHPRTTTELQKWAGTYSVLH